MTTIFYGKKPLIRGKATPIFVTRLKNVIDAIKRNGNEQILKEKLRSSKKSYTFNGLSATIDIYYEDRTLLLEGVGVIHYGMNSCESYFDINITELVKAEKMLGIEFKKKRAA